jgi:hypothetical protein
MRDRQDAEVIVVLSANHFSCRPGQAPTAQSLTAGSLVPLRAAAKLLMIFGHFSPLNIQPGPVARSWCVMESRQEPAWLLERTGFEPSRPLDSAVMISVSILWQ